MIHRLPYLTNHKGHLHIESVDANALAEQYGTPLYVYSKTRILENYHRMKSAFQAVDIDVQIHYAIKTNSNLALLHILRAAGAGADVSCEGEMKLAHHAGFPIEKIIYSGNNNPDEELGYSLNQVGMINLDHFTFLPRLLAYGKPSLISFRINPGFGKASHDSNVFAGKTSKFGMDPKTALSAYKMAKKAGIKRFGIHMMPASGGLNQSFFPEVTEKIFEAAEMIAKKAGITFEFVNIGGGFGIPYKEEETPLDLEKMARDIGKVYHAYLKKGTVGQPQLFMEPGRIIVGDAGVLLSRVHAIKDGTKQGYRRFAGTDSGMNTLIRPALHGSHHEILCANKMNGRKKVGYTVCGRICENTDQHPGERLLSELAIGDLLATLDTGAYGFTMASTFNNYGRPAEVLVSGDRHALIRKRETIEDLIRPMIVPEL